MKADPINKTTIAEGLRTPRVAVKDPIGERWAYSCKVQGEPLRAMRSMFLGRGADALN